MSMKRSKRTYSNPDLTTKHHKAQKGLFVYNIPIDLSVAEFNSNFKELETFVPTVKDNHIRIAYILVDSNVQTSNIIKKLNSLGTLDNYEFDTTLHCSIDKAVTEIQSISSEIVRLAEDQACTKIQVENMLNTNKQRSIVLLAENYSVIMGSYYFLKNSQTYTVSQNQEINHCIWLVIYSFCYFIAYKLSNDNLTDYECLFNSLTPPQLFSYINKLRSCNSIQRYLAINFLWQITFMKDQFKCEEDVIDYLLRSPIYRPTQLKTFAPSLFDLLSKILITDLVNSHVSVGVSCQKVVEEFVSNIYLTRLPESIQGLSIFRRYVVIKNKCKTSIAFEDEPVLRSYTLMTALHEYGHFAQTVHLNSDLQCLNHEYPEIIDPVTQKKSHEAGNVLMRKIFGYDPVAINIQASNFLFDIQNWDLDINEFQCKFQSLNENIPIDLIMNRRTTRARLKVSVNQVSLIGCLRSNRSSNERK